LVPQAALVALSILPMTELIIVLDDTIVTVALPADQEELACPGGRPQWNQHRLSIIDESRT